MTVKRVLLCAGGTGGHVFPARAVGEELARRGVHVDFVTDARGEKYLAGCENVHLVSAGQSRGGWKGRASFARDLLRAYWKSHRLIARLRPDIVVGFGGFPSAPPVFAAQHRRVPTLLHEQNAVLGLANKMLAPLAKTIALSCPLAEGDGSRRRTVVTGNPVRAEIAALRDAAYPAWQGEVSLLIVGGSLGAASFGGIVPLAVVRLAAGGVPLRIAHQARAEDLESVRALYADAGISADVRPFFDDMAARIAAAHLLVCRAGATTIAELTCAGRAAVYIPYPWHKDQQQLHNARQVERAGGGRVIEEKTMTPDTLHSLLADMCRDPVQLARMSAAARDTGRPDAAARLADLILA